jgi:hypothetical protein
MQMRKSFFTKLTVMLLLLLWMGWAGFVYASPSEWLELTGIFVLLTLAFGGRAYAAGRAAEREHGFANEDGTWPDKQKKSEAPR